MRRGQKPLQLTAPGGPAGWPMSRSGLSFDEALESLIESHPQKDYILKASGNSGGGSHQSQHQAGQKTMKRDAFDSLDNAGKQAALKDGVSIVD